jgi:hypothetical protein
MKTNKTIKEVVGTVQYVAPSGTSAAPETITDTPSAAPPVARAPVAIMADSPEAVTAAVMATMPKREPAPEAAPATSVPAVKMSTIVPVSARTLAEMQRGSETISRYR